MIVLDAWLFVALLLGTISVGVLIGAGLGYYTALKDEE